VGRGRDHPDDPSSDGLLFLSLALTGFLAAAFCAWVARIVEERR
jgi:hypothetical protein